MASAKKKKSSKSGAKKKSPASKKPKKQNAVSSDPSAEDESVEVLEPEIVDPEDVEIPEVVVIDDDDDVIETTTEGGETGIVPTRDTAAPAVPRDSLSAYMSELAKYAVLSREEEHELAVRYYEQGDREAAYRLITSNLRLVVMVAREYQRAFHNLLDLVQEGNVGLLEAVQKFDPYRGVRLPSYAVWWIRAYIIRYIINNFRLVKLGTTQAQRRLFFNLKKERAKLEAEGFRPTAEMLAERLGVREQEVIEMDMRMRGGSEVSTDAPVSTESETRVLDLLPYDDQSTEEEFAEREFFALMKDRLDEFGETLEGREAEVFAERMLADDPITLRELGERYGVSRERVRQIEEGIKNRLRDFLVEKIRPGDDQDGPGN